MAAPVLSHYKSADAGASWDEASGGTLRFRLVPGQDGDRAREAIESLDLPVKVAFVEGSRSTADLVSATRRVVDSRSVWARGLLGFGYAAPDPARGALLLGVDERYVDRWRAAVTAADLGVPVFVRGEPQVGAIPQLLVADVGRPGTLE